jgi:hypothetical protein
MIGGFAAAFADPRTAEEEEVDLWNGFTLQDWCHH